MELERLDRTVSGVVDLLADVLSLVAQHDRIINVSHVDLKKSS